MCQMRLQSCNTRMPHQPAFLSCSSTLGHIEKSLLQLHWVALGYNTGIYLQAKWSNTHIPRQINSYFVNNNHYCAVLSKGPNLQNLEIHKWLNTLLPTAISNKNLSSCSVWHVSMYKSGYKCCLYFLQ